MAHFQLNSERDNTRKMKEPRRSLEALSLSPKSETGPKSKETKFFEAACRENVVFCLAFLKASEEREFPRAMPKEARAYAAEEGIVSKKLKRKETRARLLSRIFFIEYIFEEKN